jgi:ABC-type glycerol-3-phosphate transport system permease component
MMGRLLALAVLAAGVVVMAFPFLWMLGTSLKTLPESLAPGLDLLPVSPQWSNYVEVFRAAPFARYFFNSFFVAGAVTLGVALSGVAAGYAFARLHFPLRRTLFMLTLATMMIPFEIALIPNFVLITKFGWYDTYLALIVPWCANAFSIFLIRQAFLSVPEELYEAARVDGCGHLRFLVWIGFALVRPAVVTSALFAFLGSYNSLLWPLVVTGDDRMRVVQVGLTVFAGDAGVRMHLLMAASAVVIAPTVALYFLAQRQFLDSALGSGLKG